MYLQLTAGTKGHTNLYEQELALLSSKTATFIVAAHSPRSDDELCISDSHMLGIL